MGKKSSSRRSSGPSMRPHVVPGPAGMRVPVGVPMGANLPQFPPELDAALRAAKRSDGRFMVAVWSVDDAGTINLQRTTGGAWNYDWFLRALKMFERLILDIDPNPPRDSDEPPIPAEAATAEPGADSNV